MTSIRKERMRVRPEVPSRSDKGLSPVRVVDRLLPLEVSWLGNGCPAPEIVEARPDIRSCSLSNGVAAIRGSAIVTFLCVLLGFSPYLLLVGGGILMCCLYAPGERIDARGYWILAVMLVPSFLMVALSLIWGEPQDPNDDSAKVD